MNIRPQIATVGYESIIYSISNLLTKITALLLVPIYTNILSLPEVGIIIIIEMIESIFIALAPLGSINAMWRFLPSLKGNKKKEIIISTFIIMIFSSCLLALFFYLLTPFIFIKNIQYFKYLIPLIIFSCFLKSISSFVFYIFQYQNKPKLYLSASLFQFFSIYILSIYFIVFLKIGIIGILISKILIFLIFSLFSITYILKSFFILPSISNFKNILQYGIPIIPFALIMPAITHLDRLFINYYLSLEELALYGVAFKFGMLIQMFLVVPIDKTFSPNLFKIGSQSPKKLKIYSDIAKYYSLVGLVFLFFTILFSKELLLFFTNSNYASIHWLIPIISLSYYIGGFRTFFKVGPSLKDRTVYLSIIGFLTIIINIFFNYSFIKYFGLNGALASKVFSFSFLVMIMLFFSKKTIKIYWPIKKIISCIFIIIIISIFYNYLNGWIIFVGSFIKFSLLLFFGFLLYVFRVFDKRDLNKFKKLFNSFRLGKNNA